MIARLVIGILCLAAMGCKPPFKPDPEPDDAGVDGGAVDAGWPAGTPVPDGFQVGIAAPATSAPGSFGVGLSMVVDQHGDPLLVWIHADPNGDGNGDDGQLFFARWNGLSASFTAPVRVDVVGAIERTAPHRPLSLARDAQTGEIGVAYVAAGQKVKLAVSGDDGATWSLRTLGSDATAPATRSSPALAMAAGTQHAAWFELLSGVTVSGQIALTRVGAQSGTSIVPTLAGSKSRVTALAAALDGAGKLGLAWAESEDGTLPLSQQVGYWRDGLAGAVSVAASASYAKAASVSLAFRGELPLLAYHLETGAPDAQLWLATATSAAASAWMPRALPRNALGGVTENSAYFQALALGEGTKLAVAANYLGNLPAGQCGGPKVVRTADGAIFTSCGPDGTQRTLGAAGLYVNAAFSGSPEKLTLAFVYESTNPSVGKGIVVWRGL